MKRITRREAIQQIAVAGLLPVMGSRAFSATTDSFSTRATESDRVPVYVLFHGPWGLVFYPDHVQALAPPLDKSDHFVSGGDYSGYVGLLDGGYAFAGTSPVDSPPDPDPKYSIRVFKEALKLQIDPQSQARVSIALPRPAMIIPLNYADPKNWLSGKHAAPINQTLTEMPETLLFQYETGDTNSLSLKPGNWKAAAGKFVELHFFIWHLTLPGSLKDPHHTEEKHSFHTLRGLFPDLDLELAIPDRNIVTHLGAVPNGLDPDHVWGAGRSSGSRAVAPKILDGTGANCGSPHTIVMASS